MAMQRLTNINDRVKEGRSSVRVEKELVERSGWIVNS